MRTSNIHRLGTGKPPTLSPHEFWIMDVAVRVGSISWSTALSIIGNRKTASQVISRLLRRKLLWKKEKGLYTPTEKGIKATIYYRGGL